MNYPPLMQQLPPMPMSSNYPSGPHEQNSAPSGGPPAQYSPVMHGMAQSAHAVSQSNYMLQSNAAAASLSNNNLCNDFGPKSQRCSNIAMVQGGCMNTNMNSMHQGAPNYSNINGATGANYMNGGEIYGGYQTMPQQMNSMPLRQANVSAAAYGGNVPQQPAMHPNHPHNGLNQHFSSIHRKSVPPNYNPYTMQSQGMNASTGYPMTTRPPNLQQQQQRHFMMQQQPQLMMQQKSGNINSMGGFKGVAGNGMDAIAGMSQPPYSMNCSTAKASNSQIMRLPSSNSPSYSVNNIPLEMQNSNKSLPGVQVNLSAMQPPVAPQPQNSATLTAYPGGGGGSRNLQLQQESQNMSMISKADAAFSKKVGLNSLVCSPPVSAPANNNNDVAFRNQQSSLSPGFCQSPNPKIVSPNVSMHSQLLASPCIQNSAATTNLPRDQSIRSVPAMATSPFSPSHRKRNNSNGAASPAHSESLGCEAKIQKTLSVPSNTDSILNGVKAPEATSDSSSCNESENSGMRQKFDDLVIEIVCRTPVTTTPSFSEKTEVMGVGVEEVLNVKSLTKNSLNGLVTQTGSKLPSSNSSMTLSVNDKSPLSKLIQDLQIDKLEKLPDLKDDYLDDLNMITSKRLPSCNVQEKTSANANPSFVPS